METKLKAERDAEKVAQESAWEAEKRSMKAAEDAERTRLERERQERQDALATKLAAEEKECAERFLEGEAEMRKRGEDIGAALLKQQADQQAEINADRAAEREREEAEAERQRQRQEEEEERQRRSREEEEDRQRRIAEEEAERSRRRQEEDDQRQARRDEEERDRGARVESDRRAREKESAAIQAELDRLHQLKEEVTPLAEEREQLALEKDRIEQERLAREVALHEDEASKLRRDMAQLKQQADDQKRRLAELDDQGPSFGTSGPISLGKKTPRGEENPSPQKELRGCRPGGVGNRQGSLVSLNSNSTELTEEGDGPVVSDEPGKWEPGEGEVYVEPAVASPGYQRSGRAGVAQPASPIHGAGLDPLPASPPKAKPAQGEDARSSSRVPIGVPRVNTWVQTAEVVGPISPSPSVQQPPPRGVVVEGAPSSELPVDADAAVAVALAAREARHVPQHQPPAPSPHWGAPVPSPPAGYISPPELPYHTALVEQAVAGGTPHLHKAIYSQGGLAAMERSTMEKMLRSYEKERSLTAAHAADVARGLQVRG